VPPSRFAILGQSLALEAWDGTRLTLAKSQGATMSVTPDGSMILAFQNASRMNSVGKLAMTSGATAPQILVAPALALQPQIVISNWKGNNLNLTNISVTDTPIWIQAYGPGLGPVPAPLPNDGTAVQVTVGLALQGVTVPQYMQLGFNANSGGLCLFAFIGGTPDTSGNNAYAIALNSPAGDTGPTTSTPAPPGYFATAAGNTYSYEFNWGTSVLFVAYFGSGGIVPRGFTDVLALPTVTLQAI
jgi:hypothetical protein